MVRNTVTTVALTDELVAEVDRIAKTEGLLSENDEKRLIEIYKLSGDTRLGADVMYVKQYDSIKKICKNFAYRHNTKQEEEDYIQSCYEYMLEALDSFKFSEGTRFNTYLSVIIRKNLNDSYYSSNGISKYYQQGYYKIGCFISSFEKNFGRTPTDEEIMDALSLTKTKYSSILAEAKCIKPVYIEEVSEKVRTTASNIEDMMTEDILYSNVSLKSASPEDLLISEELFSQLMPLLAELGPTRCDILFRYAGVGYDKPQSKKKICKETGYSKNYVDKNLKLIIDYARKRLEEYYR